MFWVVQEREKRLSLCTALNIWHLNAPGSSVFFTTYTANFAADIQENLRKICSIEELRKIEVIHLDAWVSRFMRESGFSFQIGYDDALAPIWEKALFLANTELPYDVSFYQEE